MARQKSPAAVGLLRAIREHPDDDLPRLVYADWLEEHGEPQRAEFIRSQVELARGVESEQRRQALRAREAELLETHAAGWTEPLAGLVRGWRFSRGFIERVTLTPAGRDEGYRIYGEREERPFTMCSPGNPNACRTWTLPSTTRVG